MATRSRKPKAPEHIPDGCAGCEYYTAEPRADAGICRRYPPIAVTDDEGFGFTQPPVEWNEWCGEFRRRVT